VKKNSELIVNS